MTNPGAAGNPFFDPEVAVQIVKLACQRPDDFGRSLSQWDCSEIARQLIEDGIVESISTETVRRVLWGHKLKPWRHHMWLSSGPRNAEFYQRIGDIIDLYTRDLADDEMVFCTDEKTSLQPRPRPHPTKPARPGNVPNVTEHTYRREGALNLFAAFDTRTGRVYGRCYRRKRQKEFIAFLGHIDRQTPADITTIHIICDNLSTHHGKQVRAWLTDRPRFRLHFTPVHCSWMNQVEQWFSILERKRFRIADFHSIQDLRTKIEQFIDQWNNQAHPFNWSTRSVAKVMADVPEKTAA